MTSSCDYSSNHSGFHANSVNVVPLGERCVTDRSGRDASRDRFGDVVQGTRFCQNIPNSKGKKPWMTLA